MNNIIFPIQTESDPEWPKAHTGVTATTQEGINAIIESGDQINLFPKNTVLEKLPSYVYGSLSEVRKLSPEKQAKISYCRSVHTGIWFININGTVISLQDGYCSQSRGNSGEGTESYVRFEKGKTYFSYTAAQEYAALDWWRLPSSKDIENIEAFLKPVSFTRVLSLSIEVNDLFWDWKHDVSQMFKADWRRGNFYIPSYTRYYGGIMIEKDNQDEPTRCLFFYPEGTSNYGHTYGRNDAVSIRVVVPSQDMLTT